MTTNSVQLDVPPAVVFAALVDAEHYPDWLIGARAVLRTDADWPRPGSSFEHEVGVGPLEGNDTTSVRREVSGELLELRVRARPFLEAIVEFRVEPHGAGTRLTMTERPAGIFRAVAPLISPLVGLRNRCSLHRLQRRLRAPAAD